MRKEVEFEGSGEQRKLPKKKIYDLVELALGSPPNTETHWTADLLAKAVGIEPSTARVIPTHQRSAPNWWQHFDISNDPDFENKVRDIRMLYKDPPDRAVVLSISGKTQKIPPIITGQPATMKHDYKGNGTTTLFVALNALDGKVFGHLGHRHAKRYRSREFISFLDQVEKKVPAGRRIHATLNNNAVHKHRAVEDWLKEHSRWTFYFTPTSCSWMNAVEDFFKKLSGNPLRHGDHESINQVESSSLDYIEHYNKNEAKPYQWPPCRQQPATPRQEGNYPPEPYPTELASLTITDAKKYLRAKEISAVELVEACIKASREAEELNLYCHVSFETAREHARAADSRLQESDPPSMCGIPIGVKDLFCMKGIPTQAASKMLSGFKPSYESTVTAKLRSAGAVMLGKLNMDEFAMGSSSEHSVYGPAVSPWRPRSSDARFTPGGSSGGSAGAVAADLCLGALGTDTGGSIRQPAAFTGTVGLKPTYGRCSRWGIVAFASSLDQAGPLTKSVRDAAIMLEAMAGPDSKDSTSAEIPVPDFESYLDGSVKEKTIGIPREYRIDGMPDEIEAVWSEGAEMLKSAGARIVDISLPHTQYALPAYYVIAPAEASSNLARYDGVRYGFRAKPQEGDGIVEMYERSRAEGFGPEVKRRIMIGTYVLSQGFYNAYYRRAQRVRRLILGDFENAFNSGTDVILTPTTPSSAFRIGEIPDDDPVKMYLNDVFTVTVNMAGLPAVSVPAKLDGSGMPLGLQLIGQPMREGELLNAAYALETAAQFREKPSKWWKRQSSG